MAVYGFLSSFPPTRCGLATFADALAAAMTTSHDTAVAVRVLERPEPGAMLAHSNVPVVATLTHGDRASVDATIRALNATDVAIIQHEYGIYGGTDGDQVLEVMRGLTVPTIAVLHTVLDAPTTGQRWVLEEVMRLSNASVVMSRTAMARARSHYTADSRRIHVIPHGVTPPHVSSSTALHTADAAGTSQRPVILTWGLLGPGKGIEWGIRALAHIDNVDPPPIYRVLGQTHPKVLAREGYQYQDSLLELANGLNLHHSFELHPTYMDKDTLAQHVEQASVVLLPYDSTAQITSGVLAEAIAAGKPVVATAFPHAIELLATGAGTVVQHADPPAMAYAIEQILTRPHLARAMSESGKAFGRTASWPAVGREFRGIAQQIAWEVPA